MKEEKRKGAPIGNQFWRLRKDMTEDGKKLTEAELWTSIQEYVNRCVTEVLEEIDFRGKDVSEVKIPKRICMSIWGACVHLGICVQTWFEWKKDRKYIDVLTRAETLFKAYNIELATSGFLKENIIARIEGIKDSSAQELTIKDELAEKTDEDLNAELDELES